MRSAAWPEHSPLTGEVEVDEFWLDGYEEDLKGSRQHGKKALVGAAIEVRGAGSRRLRQQVLANSRAKTLEAFTTATTPRPRGAIVHTDGLNSYAGLTKLGYSHRPRKQTGAAPGDELMPRVHRAISNLKAWMHGTHRRVSKSICLSTSTSSSSATTGGAPRWLFSRPCLRSARSTIRRPMARSRRSGTRPESTGYASAY